MSNNAPPQKFPRRTFLRSTLAGTLVGCAGVGWVSAHTEDLEIVERDLTLPRWDSDGFRVVVLGDLHANWSDRAAHALRAIDMAAGIKADLCVVVGDFASFVDRRRLPMLQEIGKRFGLFDCPVIGILGNHDYWSGGLPQIIGALAEGPLVLLRNQVTTVQGVQIFGLDDALVGRHDPTLLNSGPSRSSLVLLHEPDHVVDLPKVASLQISGHSHGGQICLPDGVALYLPPGGRNYFRGFYPEAPTPLYVNRGIGTTGPTVRTFCRPEISVLTLRSA